MASITTESEVNDEESKDVVLEMRNFVRADDPPISPRLSYLVTLDSRRQQVLIEFQILLHNASTSSMCQHQHASDHQEPKLTKEIFCQVFSKRVSFGIVQHIAHFLLNLYWLCPWNVTGNTWTAFQVIGSSSGRENLSNKYDWIFQRKIRVNS